MLDIVDIIFAPTIDPSLVAFLRSKILEHHMKFTRPCPEVSVIPKMHFMVHYPILMLRYCSRKKIKLLCVYYTLNYLKLIWSS